MAEKFRSITDDDIKKKYQENQDSLFRVKLKVDEFNTSQERAAVIRFLTLIVDFSAASQKQDLRPNRSVITKAFLQDFIKEFIEQNPLSKLCVIVTYKEDARLLSDFIDSAEDHCTKLLEFKEFEGNPSLQNSLELACENFRSVPSYASKEVLCVFSSLTNSDPGNIFQTIARLKQDQISCSVISLSAAIHILQKLAEETHGQFKLAKDKDHLEDLFKVFLVPSSSFEQKVADSQDQVHKIGVGFPKRVVAEYSQVCSCHGRLRNKFYVCSFCQAAQCDLSCSCRVCGTFLVSSAKLLRTVNQDAVPKYLTVESFLDNPINSENYERMMQMNAYSYAAQILGQFDQLQCRACSLGLELPSFDDQTMQLNLNHQYEETSRPVICTSCCGVYCIECDIYIHETLLQCPTCTAP